jgi:hypothetical protein
MVGWGLYGESLIVAALCSNLKPPRGYDLPRPYSVFQIAFSSEVDAGSHQENASNRSLKRGSDAIGTKKAPIDAKSALDGDQA